MKLSRYQDIKVLRKAPGERGMILMKHYLKFDEIRDPFLAGLRKVGPEINQAHRTDT